MHCSVQFLSLAITICGLLEVYAAPSKYLMSQLSKRTVNTVAGDEMSMTNPVKNFHVREGHTIRLECEVEGKQKSPVIHWRHNGQHVIQGPRDHMAENILPPATPDDGEAGMFEGAITSATLTIHTATQRDAGKYTCVAETENEKVTQTYQLIVTPTVSDLPTKRNMEEECQVDIYQWSSQIYKTVGKRAYLICRATQGTSKCENGAPVVTWMFDDQEITSSTPGVLLHDNGDLEVLQLEASLSDVEIACVATGTDGTQTRKTPFVYVMLADE